jgi:hypothetical protein
MANDENCRPDGGYPLENVDDEYSVEPRHDKSPDWRRNKTDTNTPLFNRGSYQQYGHRTELKANGTVGTMVFTPSLRDGVNWIIVLQLESLPFLPPAGMATGTVQVTVEYGIGNSTFRKTFPLADISIVRVPVVARRVTVSAAWVGRSASPANNTDSIFINGGLSLGWLTALDFYTPTWFHSGAAPVSGALVKTGPGVVLAATVDLVSATLSPLFFCFYDSAVFPPPVGTPVIPGGMSTPLTAAGTSSTFKDEENPAVFFVNGLVAALSTTPDVFTPPPAGNTASFDVKTGV